MVIVMFFSVCCFLVGYYLFAVLLLGFLSFWHVLMIAQKILFAVRVNGCWVCDISGVSVEYVNISYVLTER
ncbi:hypothetical protein EMIT0P4_100164 [Pseudomonas sp. IT-P4]